MYNAWDFIWELRNIQQRESGQGWKQARVKVSKKNLSQKLCLPPWLCWLIFSGFFSRPISPFLRLPNKMWSWEPKQPSRHYWFPITRFGSQQNVNLGSQKTLPFRLQDFPLLLLSTFHLPDFFGSFIILVSSILSFLLLLGSLIYALWEPKKGVNLGSQTTVILPPLFFHSSPLLDIGS